MILADTSIWIDHFRSVNEELQKQLQQGSVVIHPFVIAELALGSLQKRDEALSLLDLLPKIRVAQMNEVRVAIEARSLYSRGIGLIDAHLIASIFVNPPALLWTRDKQLRKVAENLAIHANLA